MRHPRYVLAAALAAVLAGSLLAPAGPAAADQTIGYPTFDGPAVPEPPVGYTTDDMMQTIYDDEAAGGGTDFWIDRLLARSGSDPAGAWLMTRGRALFMKTHSPGTLGFGGDVAYWESISDQNAYTVSVSPGGFSEQVSQRRQTPSHWHSVHNSGSVSISQDKFITDNNVAVTNLAITNNGGSTQNLTVRATSPYATSGSGGELVGSTQAYNGLTTITTRFSGDGFGIDSGGLERSVSVSPGQTMDLKLQMGFTTTEIAESLTEYDDFRGMSPSAAFWAHVREYNQWWADNVPYIDVPEPAIKKNIYYRWWLMRFNHLDANIPGQTFQFPTSMEGVLGYNNAIVLTQPMHVDDLKYLRDPYYSYGPWLSVGQTSQNGRFRDNPGDPENWSNSYTQYLAEAAWKSYQIHGGQPGIVENLAHYAEQDVKGQLDFYDTDNNDIIEYDWGALTGNDADAVSFHWRSGNLDRAESAYQYSGARAAADAYALLGDSANANEMDGIAEDIQDAIINVLWNPSRDLLEHRHVSTGDHVPWKEINNYYPYAVGAMPDTATYREALRLFDDPDEYPIFPFYTANQADKAESGTGSNNFSTINSTVQFRLLSSVLRNYPNQPWIDSEWYKKLLYWNAWAQYVDGNTAWPDANEFWADWNPGTQTIEYRSWIHHNILGSSNWTIIEDVAGLRPRTDDQVELSPIDIDWSHFTVNNVRYRNSDLTIVWDDPNDGSDPYPGVPSGYSIYVDGNRELTVDDLVHLLYDPADGSVSFPGQSANVLFNSSAPGMQAPIEVEHDSDHMVDMLAKAGVDITDDLPNLAEGASVSASSTSGGTSTGAAVDGYPINNPFWGSGSGGSTAWYQVNFGQQQAFDEVRLYFRDSRPQSSTYRAPASYDIQYLDGGSWVSVSGQVKTPGSPQGNYNRVQFPAVTASQMRVFFNHASGTPRTGLTELQVYNRGGEPPPPPPPPPGDNLAPSATASCSYTSSWESCDAINDDIDPPSSNDTVNPRWGTWPEVGTQWIQLDWDEPVEVAGSDLYFFQDSSDGSNNGVKRAESWQIEYWDGSQFVDVPNPSGYGTALNAYNATSFDPVTTTALRATVETRSDADGVGALEWKVYGEDGGGGGEDVDHAPSAGPVCSYTSSWEDCSAINDDIDPPSSNDTVNPRWGTWPEEGEQWADLQWSSPVTLTEADVYFFDDNQGIDLPASWELQYWDGSSYVSVSNPSGYPTAADQYNTVTFDEVTTTRLRVLLQSAADSVGLLEINAWGPQ